MHGAIQFLRSRKHIRSTISSFAWYPNCTRIYGQLLEIQKVRLQFYTVVYVHGGFYVL